MLPTKTSTILNKPTVGQNNPKQTHNQIIFHPLEIKMKLIPTHLMANFGLASLENVVGPNWYVDSGASSNCHKQSKTFD